MSDSYTFLPWVRRGLAGAIQAGDTIENGRVRIDVGATLRDKSSGATADVPIAVSLFGPGDVTGFDPRLVIRTDPVHLANDFEPNYFPVVEFDLPDFPWLFTPAASDPAASDAQDRLKPWICLVAVEKTEGKLTVDASKPLSVLHIQDAQVELPNLDEAWAWAHAQVSGAFEVGKTDDIFDTNPERTLSRLLCPRRLQPKKTYLACVVPTFKGGRQAGLGDKVDDGTALAPAWDAATKDILLPVYYHWEFNTGQADDFESLVWQLQRREELPPDVGVGSMRVRPADPADPSPPWPTTAQLPLAELPLEGALRPYREAQTDPLTDVQAKGDYKKFQETLRGLLNGATPAADLPPGLPTAPPIYGRWHAAQGDIPASPPPAAARNVAWLRELNLNPTHRVAAALGARIVQNQQEQLMASAWDQLGEIERANQALRQAQMARAASAAIHKGWLQALPPEVFLAATAPVQARVVADPSDVLDPAGTPGRKTVTAIVESSRTSETLLQRPFRRLASPRGPLARRVAGEGGKLLPHEIIRRVNAGDLRVASPPKAPGGMVTMDAVFAALGRGERFCAVTPGVLNEVVFLRTPPPGALATGLEGQVLPQLDALLAVALPTEAQPLLHSASDRLRSIQLRTANRHQWNSVDEIEGILMDMIAADEALFVAARSLTNSGNGNEADAVRSVRGNLEQIVTRQDRYMLLLAIKAAIQQVGMVSCDPPQPRMPPALKLERIKELLLAALDPRTIITARMKARLKAPGWNLDELEPIMAAPDFPQPMYKALADLSQDFLLPGLEHVPPNTVAGLVTNPRFIEAFMVGLNHEMGRELLWRGFPTDQRGSYFRQFWETRGRVPAPTGDSAKDIVPIHTWKSNRQLGENLNQQAVAGGMITLLIRGELLRRYPRAMIYLAEAIWSTKNGAFVKDSQGRYLRQPSATTEEYPIFSGELPPDITFLGFAKSPEDADAEDVYDTQTSDPSAEPAGWFIVIQQPPTEPRFGLDKTSPDTPTGTWNDLAWPDIETTHTPLEGEQVGYIRVAPPAKQPARPNNEPDETKWGASSAAMAYITMQLPFRAAIHASDLL
jgi:hypothetical protein